MQTCQAISQRLSADPSLALTSCHFTGLSPIHWAVKHNNREMVRLLVKEYNVSPDLLSRAGSTPLQLAATYGRREIYNDLLHEFGADPKLVDFSGQKAEAYIDYVGHGSNKIWQDLAMDIQTFQRKCFEEHQRRRKEQRSGKQDPRCFEGLKKRHSIGF